MTTSVRAARASMAALVALVAFVAFVALAPACRRRGDEPKNGRTETRATGAAPSASASSSGLDLRALAIAVDQRSLESIDRAAGAPSIALRADDRARRLAYVRALAETALPSVRPRLLAALADEDPDVRSWAAYGLGIGCDVDAEGLGDERAKIVAALAARVAGIARSDQPWSGLGWALGRCGETEAAHLLAHHLTHDLAHATVPDEPSIAALGAIAKRTHGLEDDVVVALVTHGRSHPLALWPLTRGDWGARPRPAGLADVARALFSAPDGELAIRAYPKAATAPVDPLRSLLADAATAPSSRVEALRALALLGDAGLAEIAAFATRAAPLDGSAPGQKNVGALAGPGFGALRVALELLADAPPSATRDTSLRAFVSPGAIPAALSPALARRWASLRCAAAAALHPGAPTDPELSRCADGEPSLPPARRAELDAIGERARVTALDHGELTGARRDAWEKLARSASLVARERALDVAAKHPELEGAAPVIAAALSAREPGLVASAADAVAKRPALAMRAAGPSREAIARALDPKVKSVDVSPTRAELDPAVKAALDGALARGWEEADAEIQTSLAAAVAALRYPGGRAYVARLCRQRPLAIRLAARDALRALDPKSTERCDAPAEPGPESSALAEDAKKVSLRIEIDALAEPLFLDLDPDTAPLAVTRMRMLAVAKFFDGIVVHRVVPGFVVQFGDPGGDGYGGAREAMRCETAPVPFHALDVGVALAGRDTGSSQLFVTLARTPQLDGSYARLGHARGPWSAVAEGDVVTSVRVE